MHWWPRKVGVSRVVHRVVHLVAAMQLLVGLPAVSYSLCSHLLLVGGLRYRVSQTSVSGPPLLLILSLPLLLCHLCRRDWRAVSEFADQTRPGTRHELRAIPGKRYLYLTSYVSLVHIC